MKKFPCLKVMMLATLLALLLTGASFAEKLTINGSLPDGRVGIPYRPDFLYLTGYRRTNSYIRSPHVHKWMIINGSLPPGLKLWMAELGDVSYDDWRGNIKAEISGTPTKAGTYTFTVFVYDMSDVGSETEAERTYTITITDISENGGNTGGNDNSTTNGDQTSVNNNTGDNDTTYNNDTTGNNTNTNNNGNNANTGTTSSSGGGCNTLPALAIILATSLTLRKSRA